MHSCIKIETLSQIYTIRSDAYFLLRSSRKSGFSRNNLNRTEDVIGVDSIRRKHLFIALNKNIIKNRMEKKKLEQFLSKGYDFAISNFSLYS